MHETDIFTYFAFGYNYNLLQYSSEGRSLKGDGSVERSLAEFFDYLDSLNLLVTKRAAQELYKLYKETKEMEVDEKELVDGVLAQRITDACGKLDTTLDAELQLRTAFVVTPKRFDLDNLLKKPERLLGEEAKVKMPPVARFDFASACRAIAFGLPTSAAFHLMRCVEAMLREYYCVLVKRNRVKGLMWNNMVTHLRKRQDTPPKALLDHLDNIRTNFRNPT